LLAALVAPEAGLTVTVSIATLVFLAVLGVIGGRSGGANVWRAAIRVTFWGAIALAATALVGRLFGVAAG
jgi:VIT1/CCC1 family predicted Fe2+/Mn2+ transporter